MLLLSDVILSARLSVGDGPTDNLARKESLDNNDIGNNIDGVNTIFSVVNYPVVSFQTVQVDYTILSPVQYIANKDIGQLQFTTAPTGTAYATYFYYLMPDTTWAEFVATALEKLNLSTGVTNLPLDLLSFMPGLLPALKKYACAEWCMRLASQTGLWYNQKLQERAEDRENISRKFMQLAQEFTKQGDTSRNDYYNGAGSQFKPSFRIVEMAPRQITPYR